MAERAGGEEYWPICGEYDCVPAIGSHTGRSKWTCRHGREFVLCEDGPWEPLLTTEEGAKRAEENRPRTAAWDALLKKMGLPVVGGPP